MDQITWTHPTGNAPQIVTLVCIGPSRNAYIGGCFEEDLSDSMMGVDEVWTLNRGVSLYRHDLLFVMDHIQGEADRFPRYGARLWQHDRPIITSDDCEGWPAHVHRYPFNEIWNWTIRVCNPMHGDWFHNSLAYILTYAGFIGVKELRVFGADYSHHHNGVVEDGHPCVAYWVGKMEAAGLVVKVPHESAFLNINQRHFIYGYKEDPRTIPANRSRFRAMVGLDAAPESKALLSGERQVAPKLEGIQEDHLARYRWAALLISEKDRVIDFGAGVGYGSAILADKAAEVLMVERSEEAVAYAGAHYARPNLSAIVKDLDHSRFHCDPRADVATAFEIIEHLSNPKPFLQSIPTDTLLASVPNEDVIPYSPQTAPFHHRHYTQDEFASLLRECGWHIVSWHGQQDPSSPVIPYKAGLRTLVVECKRCQDPDLSTTTASDGDSAH